MAKTNFLQIFRAGRHQPMQGSTLDFTEADLDASARAYDPSVSEAPIVVGHPAINAPAYGWIRKLVKTGSALEAEPAQVDPAFADMVKAGRFKKISSSFYLPDSPNNPVPGVYYLRHVGFLGAVPPAVKGLRDAMFADADDFVTVEFADMADQAVADVFRALREWLIETQSAEIADRIVPNWTIDTIIADAMRDRSEKFEPDAAMQPAGFSETSRRGNPMADNDNALAEREQAIAEAKARLDADADAFAEKQAEIDARAAEIEARESALRAREEGVRIKSISDFADGMVTAGKLLPRDKSGAISFMASLPANAIEFGEGDSKTPLDWFKGFLSSLPEQVNFSEIAADDGATGAVASFAVPQGHTIDKASLDLHAKAIEYMKQNQGVDYVGAVHAVGG